MGERARRWQPGAGAEKIGRYVKIEGNSSIDPHLVDDRPHLIDRDEIWVDRVLKYDVWTLNINSSTFSQ